MTRTSRAVSRALATLALLVPAILTAQSMRQVVGIYTSTVESPGGSLRAVLTLTKDNGTYGGTMAAEGLSEIPIASATPSDTGVVIIANSPDGPVTVSIKFGDGDKISGKVLYSGMEMPLVGTFAAAGAAASPAGSGMAAHGTYTLATTEPIMGMPSMPVSCVITRAAAGEYSGSCGNDQGTAPVSKVEVAGNVVTMLGDSPVGPFKMVLTVTGGAAEGAMTLGNETAKVKGTFAPK
jgi:hypothetical protein